MPKHNAFRLSGERSSWLVAALFIIATGLTVSARGWLSTPQRPMSSVAAQAANGQTSPVLSRSATVQTTQGVIRLLPTGFKTGSVSGQAGQYRLVVTRANASTDLVLRLERTGGELLQEITVPRDRPEWIATIEMEAGSYTLSVVNHPEWTCQITVQ